MPFCRPRNDRVIAGGAVMAVLGLVVIVALASRGGDNSAVAPDPPRKKPVGKPTPADPHPSAKPKHDRPPAQVANPTPGNARPSDSKPVSPRSQASQSVIRVDFNRPAALAEFVLAEGPGRKWHVDRGLLQIEGGSSHTTYGKYFKSITSVTIRGGIQSPEGRNFRVSIADQNHYRLGEALSAPVVTEPRALAPGRIQEITVRQDENDVIVEINGQRQCSIAGELEGTVRVYSAGSRSSCKRLSFREKSTPRARSRAHRTGTCIEGWHANDELHCVSHRTLDVSCNVTTVTGALWFSQAGRDPTQGQRRRQPKLFSLATRRLRARPGHLGLGRTRSCLARSRRSSPSI